MKFRTEAIVTGIKCFDGTVEGTHYASTTAYCLIDMDSSNKNAIGQASAEYKSDDTKLFEKLKTFAFPVNCDLLLEQVTNGKTTKIKLLDINPKTPNQPKA